MDAEAAIDRLRALLVEERDFVRALDAERVEALAAEKEQLLAVLARALPARAELRPRLAELGADLRRNGVLLAHARDLIRDALAAARGPGTYGEAGRAQAPLKPGARLRVTG